MPIYEYECRKCGPFLKMRPVAECALPENCPACGAISLKRFPIVNLQSMRAENRTAWERNERSAHAPHVCGAGCGHQSGDRGLKPAKPKSAKPRFESSKKANSRPWMLGH